MPRVRQLTPELRREEERSRQIERNAVILQKACMASDYGGIKGVADAMGINPATLYSRIMTGSLKAVDMAAMVCFLQLDDDTVHALMGDPKMCVYDKKPGKGKK